MHARCARKPPVRFFPAVFFLLSCGIVFPQAASSVLPSPPPGEYGAPLLVSFRAPPDTRLTVSLDGSHFFVPETALLLQVKEGEQHVYTVDTELRSLLPDSPLLAKQRFAWKVDMKKPSAPTFALRSVEGGRMLTMILDEKGTVTYRMYHPYSQTFASGTVDTGATLFLPDNAYLCAFGTDPAGNRGPVSSPGNMPRETEKAPFKIVNPVPGNWSNPQVLLIDFEPGTELRYSVDGSDPSVSGLAYGGPIVLETEGITGLRILAIDSSGVQFKDQVLYTVTPKDSPEGFPVEEGEVFIETGEFAELPVPPGFSYSLGDSPAFIQGGKSILFSAVRGSRRYYPLTLSDGTSSWRWICASGDEASSPVRALLPVADRAGAKPAEPLVSVHDWYFVGLEYSAPLYYSTDTIRWTLYEGPVFIDRSRDSTLYWYSASWKNAAVQTVNLPAKPRLSGIPDNALTANPVFLSIPGSPFTFYYEIGAGFSPPLPGLNSPQLSSGVLLEVPGGASAPFSIRLLAFYDGLVHGELHAFFVEDRKAPRAPQPGIQGDLAYSRSPVTVSPTGEDRVFVSIEPDLYATDGKKFILKGDASGPVDYFLSFFSSDEAGNRSMTVERAVRVDLNALYVDATFAGTALRDGSPDAPFGSLDEAFDAVRGTGDWRIYVTGPVSLTRPHTIRSRIRIIGTDADIRFESGVSLAVSGGALIITDCRIYQDLADAQRTPSAGFDEGRVGPLIDVRSGEFSATGLELIRTGIYSGSLVKAAGSKIRCDASRFELSSSEYALLFDINHSDFLVRNSVFSVSGRDASVLSLTASSVSLSHSSFTVTSLTAGRAIESWNSQMNMSDLSLERTGETENRDTAFWFDAKTRIVSESLIKVKGFWQYKPAKTR